MSDLTTEYIVAKLTTSTYGKNNQALKASADVAEGVIMFSQQRSGIREEVEKLLLI